MRHTKLIGISMAIGFFETIQILILIPFLSIVNSIVNDREINSTLLKISDSLNVNILILSTVITVIGVILSNIVKIILYYKRFQLLHLQRKTITLKLIEAANNPIHFSQSKNKTEELRSLFTTEIENFVIHYLQPKSNLAQATISMIITLLLIIVLLPTNILVGMALIITIYFIASIYFNKINKRLGIERVRLNDERLILADIMSSANYETTLLNFRTNLVADADVLLGQYSNTISKAHFFSQFPKFIIEAVSFSLISILIYSFYNDSSQGDALFLLGSTGLAFYKAIPSIQSVYQSLTNLKFGEPVSQAINQFIATPKSCNPPLNQPINQIVVSDLALFKGDTELSKNINITFKTGDRVAIIGGSGVGKTTFIHSLLGLNAEYEGTIKINGQNIKTVDLKSYMSKISFVPNKSLNVTNFSRLRSEHHQQGNQSTGQIQRALIYAALQDNFDVLFLDEFTSSQDHKNQEILMRKIISPSANIIISIVHRTETLKYYDYVYELKSDGLHPVKNKG